MDEILTTARDLELECRPVLFTNGSSFDLLNKKAKSRFLTTNIREKNFYVGCTVFVLEGVLLERDGRTGLHVLPHKTLNCQRYRNDILGHVFGAYAASFDDNFVLLVDAPCCCQVDRSECVVRNCWQQWTREGTHAWKTGSGVNRKTTRREDRRIVRQALVDPTVTRSTIRGDVGVACVPQTISRHLAEAILKSKRPFRALSLTPELRLQWCQARSMWNVTDWQKVVFSDEFWFVLGTDDNRVRVWRRPGERFNSPYTVLHCPHSWCNGLGGHSL
ncbi:transposable element Tc1 transposase [Trichonephila clavipes]|nr:transposable element Tc1 transposase [Trichonephila clavipes]